jgi:hypothetical protein
MVTEKRQRVCSQLLHLVLPTAFSDGAGKGAARRVNFQSTINYVKMGSIVFSISRQKKRSYFVSTNWIFRFEKLRGVKLISVKKITIKMFE